MIKKLASLQLFFVLAFLMMGAMTIGTLIPQNLTPEKYQATFSPTALQIFQKLGFFNLFHSNWFVMLMVLLGVNTAACLYTRIANNSIKNFPWGAIISHCAFLIILLGGVVSGLLGQRGVLALTVGQTDCCVPPMADGNPTIHLPFQVKLTNFNVEYYDVGKHYVHVNHIKEGWKEVVEVEPGKNYKVKEKVQISVLSYLPDFRLEKDDKTGVMTPHSISSYPNNPALELEVIASPAHRVWLFANYPDFGHSLNKTASEGLHLLYQYIPGKIKQFKSDLEILSTGEKSEKLASVEASVNHPFKYGGYTFYQSGYDPQNPNFSSFQVTKDPGTPIVYAGFFLLPFGLFLSFYGGKK